MCRSVSVPISKIMEGIANHPWEHLHEGNFLFESLKQKIRVAPVSALEYLFHEFNITKKFTPEKTAQLFRRLASDCYLSYVMYVNSLCPGKMLLLEKDIKNILISSLEYTLESRQIPLTGENRVMQALVRLHRCDIPEEIKSLNISMLFDPLEVLNDLDYYLKDADALADLPDFAEIYLSKEKVDPIAFQLEAYRLNSFGQKYIERIIDEAEKEIIKNRLKQFIETYPVKHCAKQAFAVLMTLGKMIPWEKHPFIIRFVADSFWEQKVLSLT